MDNADDAERLEQLLHNAYTAGTVRDMEAPLLEQGVPLMRMAAAAAAHVAAQMLDDEGIDITQAHIVLLAGGGDNGADGLYAAASLAEEGASVTCIAVGKSLHEGGFTAMMRAGCKVIALDPGIHIDGFFSGFPADELGDRLAQAESLAKGADLLVDAMTGIGLQGALRSIPETIACLLGEHPDAEGRVPLPDAPALPNRETEHDLPLVLAIDTPSGIGVDDGTLPGAYIPADVTVMFGALKPCAVLPPATFACGRIILVDFRFDLARRAPAATAISATEASDSIRLPRVTDSKYSRGVAGLITGSRRYPGAAVLTTQAAARTCTGMIRYLGPAQAQSMVLSALPEAVIGKGRVQAWAVGSGVPDGDADDADGDVQRQAISALLSHYALNDGDDADKIDEALRMPPIVVDAGALDLLPLHVPPQVAITPHAGELARLVNRISAVEGGAGDAVQSHNQPGDNPSGVTAADIMSRPLHYACHVAESTGATVLLKGAVTLIVNGSGVKVAGSGPAWLSTAGAGDVLAGIAVGLLAQHAELAESLDRPSSAEAAQASENTEGTPAAFMLHVMAAAASLHGEAAGIASESEQRGWQEPDLFGMTESRHFHALGHPIIASDVIRAIPETLAQIIA